MTIWMIYAVLFAGLAAAGAFALAGAARALRLPTRFVWLAALVASIAGPFALPLLVGPEVAAPTGRDLAAPDPVHPSSQPAPRAATARTAFDLVAFTRRFDRPLLALWIGLTACCFGRFVQGMVSLRRRRAQWTAREIDGTRLLVTPDLGPAVVAMPEPRIIVPEWVLALDRNSLATIIRHERQHTAAGDAWLIISGAVATSLLPWNPAMWLIRRRLRLALEVDCDARVLAEEPQVDRYGSLLMRIAQHPRATASLSATLAESTSDLERRIEAMTAKAPKFPRVRATVCAALSIAAIGLAVGLPAPALAGPTATVVEQIAPVITPAVQEVQSATASQGNPPPRYPDSLRARGIEGTVIARFVVDTLGRIEPRTFEVVKTDHAGFVEAVRENIEYVRFTPARAGGRKVRQLVQMPFRFSLSRPPATTLSRPPTTTLSRQGNPIRANVPAPMGIVGVAVADSAGAPRPADKPVVTPPVQQAPPGGAPSDTMPQPLPTNVPPIYPNQLRAANIEGAVLASFVVIEDGTVDMSTFMVLKSDHEMFSAAVRNATANLRFTPAMKDGKPIAKKIDMPFRFSLVR